MMPSIQSSFLDAIPEAMLEERTTIKLRSSGRGPMHARQVCATAVAFGARARWRARTIIRRGASTSGRPAWPGDAVPPTADDVRRTRRSTSPGERVKHRRFGSGNDRRARRQRARRQGEDRLRRRDIGRKTLVLAYTDTRAGHRAEWRSRTTTCGTSPRSRALGLDAERAATSSSAS